MTEQESRPAHSTIAQVMTGREDGAGRKRTRQSAIAEQILRIVAERPGVTASEIAREIGEKAIFVLSLVDELLRNGRIISPDRDGKLALPPVQETALAAGAPAETEKPHSGEDFSPDPAIPNEALIRLEDECQRLKTRLARHRAAGLLFDLHRLIAPLKELRIRQGCPMTVMLGDRKFLVADPKDDLLNIAIHGTFPDAALIDLTEAAGGARGRVQVAPKEHLVDVKCASAEEIRSLGPGLKKCYEHLRSRKKD